MYVNVSEIIVVIIQLASQLYSIDQATIRLIVQLMILNYWIVSSETFTIATTQVSRFRTEKLDSLSSANQIRENNESANQVKASVRISIMT